ncbi:uncharacterized protein F5Z01DRAFT_643530 [Emericellopsis atlantica]|uniref:Uncharacterized protein n=1 Tax=Emericellopsis atlantica TaxID=2614577 RepID=A0A9P7ZVM9_9HYPO|nr:uncharacterized protein F5Z01DRAFT_643530 [Emericellopsis atlantica]KAG9258545.1 hypothetical protein F5Z01DRAFT_643530 [Emericellopsis atlantica]
MSRKSGAYNNVGLYVSILAGANARRSTCYPGCRSHTALLLNLLLRQVIATQKTPKCLPPSWLSWLAVAFCGRSSLTCPKEACRIARQSKSNRPNNRIHIPRDLEIEPTFSTKHASEPHSSQRFGMTSLRIKVKGEEILIHVRPFWLVNYHSPASMSWLRVVANNKRSPLHVQVVSQ